MNSNASEYDELNVIKGIGPVRQQWLREKFNVRTYRDLAALSPEAIESQLQVEGRTVARSEIERWLAQAQELDAIAEEPVVPTKAATGALAEVEVKRPRKTEAWRPLASFTVEFREHIASDQSETYQTAVHHMEADADSVWPGIESKELCAWMLERVGDKVKPQRAENMALKTIPTAATPIPVVITQVRVIQPPNAKTPLTISETGRMIQGSINSAEPFVLEVTFQLAYPDVGISRQVTYYAQFFVRRLVTGEKIVLGITEPAMSIMGQTIYTARGPEVSLTPGIYHLQVLVSLPSTPPSASYLELPMLQVI